MNIELTVPELIAPEAVSKRLDKLINFFAGLNLSIRAKILISFLVVIFLLIAVNTMMILNVLRFNRQYDVIITNITTANNLNGFIKPAIDTEMWNIVAGKTEFKDGKQYEIINQANAQIESMIANIDSDKSKIKLEVILRTMDTLTRYVDKMGMQIDQGSRVDDNELVLENIRGVSDVVEESIQDYMLFEVNQAEHQYKENRERFNSLAVIYLILLPCTIGYYLCTLRIS
jgi:two-component system sensor histidine kinase YesM